MTEQDIQRLWRDQPRDGQVPSIEAVRRRSSELQRKVWRQNVLSAVLFAAIIAIEAWQIWREPALVERLGDALTIAALVLAAWQFRRAVAVETMPAGLGWTASIDFYRTQLARRRELESHPWRYLILFVPGVALSLFGRAFERPLSSNVAIAVFGVVLFVAAAWVHHRSARRLQQEIDSELSVHNLRP